MIKYRARLLTFLFVLFSLTSHCWEWTAAHNTGRRAAKSFHVGLILDFETRIGKMCRNCISLALEDFYAVHNHYETRLVLHAKDSKDVVSAVFADKGVKKVSNFVVLIFAITNIVLFGLFMQVLAKIVCDDTGQIIELEAKDLAKSRHFIGYQKDSFVLELVLKQLNLDQSQLKVYNSPEEYHEALQLGSQNGGVSAIFDEIPYIEVLMKKYCGKYTKVGQVYRMEGFGFVFPRGAPLVSDVSTAILSLVEGEKMKQIENKWFGSENNCQDPPKKRSSNSLSLNKVWGLFVTVLMVILSPLVLFIVAHLNRRSEHWFWKLLRCICQVDEDDNVNTNKPLEPTIDTLPDTLDVSNRSASCSSLQKETSEEETPSPSVEMVATVECVINMQVLQESDNVI